MTRGNNLRNPAAKIVRNMNTRKEDGGIIVGFTVRRGHKRHEFWLTPKDAKTLVYLIETAPDLSGDTLDFEVE